MKQKLILFIFLLFLVSVVSAAATNQKPYNVTTSCDGFDCTRINVTILAPNSSTVFFNQSMTNGGAYAYFQFTPNQVGEYTYYVFDGQNFSFGTFKSTPTGTELTTANSVIYSVLFSIMIFIFLTNIFFISQLPDSNTKDEEGRILSISYLKYLRSSLWFVEYILFIAILYLASGLAFAFLGEQVFAKVLFTIFRVSFRLAPLVVIVWIIWIFVRMFHDNQMQRMLNKGIFPGRSL